MCLPVVRYPSNLDDTLLACCCAHRASGSGYIFAFLTSSCGVWTFLKQHGDLDASILQYHLAVDLEYDLSNAWLNLGIALSAMGRADEAMRAYKVLCSTPPEFPVLFAGV